MSARLRGHGDNEGEPRDRFYLVYVCMIVAGGGFLFPWFSFISAVDYFFYLYSEDHPHVSVTFPMTYLITTLLSSTINVALVNKVPIHGRIAFGYVMFIMSLLLVPLLDIGIDNCTVNTHVSFYLTLFSIVGVGLGSGVQQSSYYGLGGMLPRRYSQGLMAGESVAGLVVAICRIITKAAFSSERDGAIAFFTTCLMFVVVCVGCQVYIRASPFVCYHIAKCRTHNEKDIHDGIPMESLSESESDRERLVPAESELDRERLIPAESKSDRERLVPAESELDQERLIPAESESDRERLMPVESEPDRGRLMPAESESGWERLMPAEGGGKTPVRTAFCNAVQMRLVVIRQIWQLIVAVTANYFVTLLVFPGLVSEVQFSPLKDWMPILLITIFNFFDFVAKWLALVPIHWSPTGLMIGSLMRGVLVPLIVLCVTPSPSDPVFHYGIAIWSSLFTMLLGLTNGYFGSLPLINTAQEVHKDKHRELAGTIMIWFLLGALTAGSVLAYALTPLTELGEDNSGNASVIVVFDKCTSSNSTR